MTAKGLRKCRAVDSEENQKYVSHRSPRALGNRWRDSHIPAAPATTAMGKWKSEKQDSHFPTATSMSLSNKSKTKGDQPQPATLSFRLISELECAHMSARQAGRGHTENRAIEHFRADCWGVKKNGAGDGDRTRDVQLGNIRVD
jgi:hypothetical protein